MTDADIKSICAALAIPSELLKCGVNSASQDKKVIVCNYIVPTKVAVQGALCYVSSHSSGGAIGNGDVQVLLRSRGGGLVHKWERIKRLGNFRVKTIPPEHPRYNDDRLREYSPDGLQHLLAVKEREGNAVDCEDEAL